MDNGEFFRWVMFEFNFCYIVLIIVNILFIYLEVFEERLFFIFKFMNNCVFF